MEAQINFNLAGVLKIKDFVVFDYLIKSILDMRPRYLNFVIFT